MIFAIKYADVECPKCGRLRVEEYDSGDLICEKCNWNVNDRKYHVFEEDE